MRSNKIRIIVASLLVTGAIISGVLGFLALTPTTNTVTVLSTPSPSNSEETPEPTPTMYSGPVKFNVTSTATMVWAARLVPPDFVNVFQVVDPEKGYYQSGGTVYLVAHFYAAGVGPNGQIAPGNEWETLVVGDVVTYNNTFYQVNRIGTPAQGDISNEPIWVNNPEDLVLITCLSRGAGFPATNNFAISLSKIT